MIIVVFHSQVEEFNGANNTTAPMYATHPRSYITVDHGRHSLQTPAQHLIHGG